MRYILANLKDWKESERVPWRTCPNSNAGSFTA